MKKRRITVTIDEDLLAMANAAVERGRADSVSSWVNGVLRDRRTHEDRVAQLRDLVVDHEREHGEITDTQMSERVRLDREAAAAVRARRKRAG